MAVTKAQKEVILGDLDTVLSDAESVAFVSFNGLSANATNDLRASLDEHGVTYKVMKKTLLKRAITGKADLAGDIPHLDGNIAIAWSTEDATAAPREVHTFLQDYKDNLTIVGGIFEGSLKNQEEMNEIATIPSMDVLRGMFANVINSPIQGFVVALNQIAEKKEG